jgi:predicted deacylase
VNISDHSITIAGEIIPPDKKHRLEIPVGILPTRTPISLPVIVINGKMPGPKLWLSAAIHGDEINGVEIIRQIMQRIKSRRLKGTIIAVPVVNIFGFLEQSRYLPDRRDLNRSFPGSPHGSLASRLAHLFMKEVVSLCTHGIDLHTAAQPRINLPQIRANLDDNETYRCAKAFSPPLLVHANTRDGSLRQAASKKGISILIYEAGEALRFDSEAIAIGIEGIMRVMACLEMYPYNSSVLGQDSLEVRQTKWVRASRGGVFHLGVNLGEKVEKRQSLGLITDAFGEDKVKVRSPIRGLVIGHIQNPLVNQGDGIVHLAVFD